jgi:histone H3/H4
LSLTVYGRGVYLVKTRAFSLYDIEEFLKEAGAERINERAVVTLERELENTVNEIVSGAQIYANYAGRTTRIEESDIELATEMPVKRSGRTVGTFRAKIKRKISRRNAHRVITEGLVSSIQTQEPQIQTL